MKIEFLGPIGRVTGSCTWMYDDEHGWNFLVDCGIQQGEGDPAMWNQGIQWPFNPRKLKFVLLTHAHMDHCGLIPLLYARGFKGKVVCTAETAQLAKIMLHDALKLNTLYNEHDIASINWYEPMGKSLVGGCLHPIDKDLFINFYRTSHIIGAVAIGIFWGKAKSDEQKKIIFSGDIGTSLENIENLPLLRHMMHPHEFDYAVIESTYGGKTREPEELTPEYRWNQISTLCDHVTTHNSTVLLPSFSLGRIQDLLFDLHYVVNSNLTKYSRVELVLDSPTANKLNPIIIKALERTTLLGKNSGKVRPVWLGKQIFRWLELDDTDYAQVDRALDIIRISLGAAPKHPEYAAKFGNALAKNWQSCVKVITTHEQRLSIVLNRPRIIVASSGSCDGGVVTHWLPKVAIEENNIISLTGYTPPSSIAEKLSSIKHLENSERRRMRDSLSIESCNLEIPYRDVKCKISNLNGYSAHTDQNGLLGWLFWSFNGQSKLTAPVVFIQHGDDKQRQALCNAINAKSDIGQVRVILPTTDSSQYQL